ncbi:putative disease resistance RPP13-like protein 2 [Vitis vinifera]|uniref:Putative disease resistance RPP13-like protein 2 n=1 Tax=Vitis vinifera TaxID=29760 RepID=A0A438GBF2_VITVI|nr:putative disease resistance RPP13-like protein 2 [Vitis vinifera]
MKIVLLRVIKKLYVVCIQEPTVLVGVEEDVIWIQRKLMRARVELEYSPEELTDVAYDFEDVIDDLLLRSPTKQRRIRNWKRCLLIIRIHKKLELIKSKIPALPCLHIAIVEGANHDNYFEERVWSDIFLIHDRSVANTIVSPVEQKVSALLALEDKISVEMDKIYAKIKNLSMHRPKKFSRQSQSRDTESTMRISQQPTTQEPNLASSTNNVHAMVKWLLTDGKSFRVIPIMGMEGIGKTILAKLIFNNKDVLNHFPFSVWTSDGYEFHLRDKEKLMDSNLSQLGDIPCLDHVLRILAESSNGSRMILTTHKISLPPNFRTRSDPHLLRLRGDEKKALSHKDAIIEEWSTVFQQFHQDQQQLWYNTLYKIHKDLSLYMRRCLFYFTLFPKDFDIPERRLMALWVAEDLVQPEGENETPEDVAERCLNMLIAQGMVQVTKKKLNGNVEMVRLPDALRQYWLSKAQQATFLGIHTDTRSELSLGTSRIRHLVDHLDKEDVSFDHIHGDYNTTSTSFPPYYEDVLSFMSFDTRKKALNLKISLGIVI